MMMPLKEAYRLFATAAIVVTIAGISSVSAWNPDIHRYESYDLERGPVFYEAYYPDNPDQPRDNDQGKRFLPRESVLEKTYQVPEISPRLLYPSTGIQLDDSRLRPEPPPVNEARVVPGFPAQTRDQQRPLGIKEISHLARQAISRDLENWNTIESYLERAKFEQFSYRPRAIRFNEGYGGKDTRNLYEEVREEPSARRLTDSAGSEDLARSDYEIQFRNPSVRETDNTPINNPQEIVRDSYPTENIFAPRPQIINYIFSRKTGEPKPEVKDTPTESPPVRNYGDNLIQEQLKKENEKDVKVTSIEISEVPRHKTRHHHGEWPKRDYSKHHQS